MEKHAVCTEKETGIVPNQRYLLEYRRCLLLTLEKRGVLSKEETLKCLKRMEQKEYKAK